MLGFNEGIFALQNVCFWIKGIDMLHWITPNCFLFFKFPHFNVSYSARINLSNNLNLNLRSKMISCGAIDVYCA